MPLKPNMTEVKGPDEAHFALLTDESGMRLAIPPGASLWIVEDKSQADKIFPMVLRSVRHNRIVLEMKQLDGSSTQYVYQLTTAKPKSKGAYERLLRNRDGLPFKPGK